MSNPPIFVLTSDKYLNALKGFSYLFNRYWTPDQGVIVAGYSAPDFSLPANFRFHSIGAQADYPIERWSDGLIKLLHDYDQMDHAILLLEDYWLTRPVNLYAIHTLYHYMQQFRYVLKMDLCADRLYAAGMSDYDHVGPYDLVRSDPASQYHMSLMPGIWNRELLLRFLVAGETPWQVELAGTPRVAAAADSVLVLGTRQWPLRILLAHRRGNPHELLLDGLKPGDVEAMRQLGYI